MRANQGVKATDLYAIRKSVQEIQETSETLIARSYVAINLGTSLEMRDLATKLTEAAVKLTEAASAVTWAITDQVDNLVDHQ